MKSETNSNDADEISAAELRLASKIKSTQGQGSGRPEPLAAKLPPVQPLTPDMLPPTIRTFLCDIAERTQCPLDFPSIALLVAAGSIVGRKVAIYPKKLDPWREFPNLWGMIVGRPGVMKSPALEAALAPLRKLEIQARQTNADETRQHAADCIMRKLKRDDAMKKARAAVGKGNEIDARELLPDEDETKSPALRRYCVNNATLEALGEILMANSNGVMVYQDEIAGLLASMGKQGNEELRPFLLQGWAAKEGYTFDRIGRGLNLHIPAFAISMLGGIQPGKVARHLKAAVDGGEGDDGMLQRFSLMVWPDVSVEWKNVDRFPDSEARNKVSEAFAALDEIEGGDDPREVRFDDRAAEQFLEWRTALEHRLRSGEEAPHFESHLSKFRKLVPALALVFTLLDDPVATVVAAPSLAMAIRWADYLETHARRAYGALGRPETEAAQRLLGKIIAGELEVINARHIYRKCWTGLSTPTDAAAALTILEDHGWLTEIPGVKSPLGGQKPLPTYNLHPEAKKHFSS